MANHTYRKGDKVYARGRGGVRSEHVGVVTHVDEGGDAYVEFRDGWQGGHDGNLNDGATNRWFFSSDELRLVAPATERCGTGPIRTITRREIVPGSVVDFVSGAFLSPTAVRPDGTIAFDIHGGFDAESLREAAHLFNQIAEVLDERAAMGEAA